MGGCPRRWLSVQLESCSWEWGCLCAPAPISCPLAAQGSPQPTWGGCTCCLSIHANGCCTDISGVDGAAIPRGLGQNPLNGFRVPPTPPACHGSICWRTVPT